MSQPYYEQDGVTIYHSDCRDVLPNLRGRMVLTDPPYNAGKNYGATTNDAQEWPAWCEWFDAVVDAALTSAPDVLAFMSITAFRKYCRHGLREPDWAMCWVKPLAMSVTALPFMPHWEPIAYFGTTRKKDGAFWGGDVITANVEFGRTRWNHPTPKPIAAMHDLVSRFDGPIIDPFCGSGTTLVAAKQQGKIAIGIEINEAYCEIAANRLRQAVLPLAVAPAATQADLLGGDAA